MKSLMVSVLLVFVLSACNQKKSEQEESQSFKIDKNALAEGFSLMEKNCLSCHSNNLSINQRIAPPMVAIKKHYISPETTQEEFTEALINFVTHPSVENSKMPRAIEKFNLMPKMNFTRPELTEIASYIYNTDLVYNTELEEPKRSPLENGKRFAMQTKKTLGKNLLQALNTQGTDHALSFCSSRAIPLTDSMALQLNTKIKRVSDKFRNPQNQANEQELAYIKKTKKLLASHLPIKPEVLNFKEKHVGYYPIVTNKMCLQCHGEPNVDIKPSTLSKIQKLYPKDQAFGYKANELRGIWVVEMNKRD